MTQYSDLSKSFFSSNVESLINYPLSNYQYPSIVSNLNNGLLYGNHPNPSTFYPASNNSTVSNARFQYIYTSSPLNTPYLTSKNKYIAPMSSSMRTIQKKTNAIGKSGYKVGLPLNYPLSYKGFSKNDVLIHTRYVRSGGCVAPKKKGSIYNNSLRNGMVCSYGSIARQTY
jgi:hypothetical protein